MSNYTLWSEARTRKAAITYWRGVGFPIIHAGFNKWNRVALLLQVQVLEIRSSCCEHGVVEVSMAIEWIFWSLVICGFTAIIYRSAVLAQVNPSKNHADHAKACVQDSLARQSVPLAAVLLSPEHTSRALSAVTASRLSASQLVHLDVGNLSESEARELLKLAKTDPREALRRVSQLPASERRILGVRLIRVIAIGYLLWQGPDSNGDGYPTYKDVREYFERLPANDLKLAADGIDDVKEIEKQRPEFFIDSDLEVLVNRVGIPCDIKEPGRVQRVLGWTKVFYFIFTQRYFELEENHPDTEDLRDLPSDARVNMQDVRFISNRPVVSICMVGARRASSFWVGFYLLGASDGSAGDRVKHLNPYGVLSVRSDGRYHIEYASDSAATAVIRVPKLGPSEAPIVNARTERIEQLLTDMQHEICKRV